MTIMEMLERNANIIPEKPAILSKNASISYKILYEKSNAFANFLLNIGLCRGEKVGLLVKKTPEAVISFLGVAAAGGIVFPIDYTQTIRHIKDILEFTRPSVLVVDTDFQELLQKLRLSGEERKIIVVGKRRSRQYIEWEDIMAAGDLGTPEIRISDEDVVYLNFTSGTTGVPKAAVTTHGNIYWNTLSAVEGLNLTRDDVHLCMFPVYCHPHELFARPLLLGGSFVLIDGISPKAIANAVSEYNVSCMMAVASIYDVLIRYHDRCSFSLSTLRIPESGGMTVREDLRQKFKERFNVPIIPVWGSTETSGVALAKTVDAAYVSGAIGKPCPYYEAKVIGEDGKEVAINEIGEMAIKGPGVCSGYFENPEETDKHMKNGWYFTGDMVKKDDDGCFHFLDRKTRMIKVAGIKVFPVEIENIIASFPKVAEVAVVSTADGAHGEVPKAVIVPKENETINPKDIIVYCKQKMHKHKIPRFVEIRTELPKNPGGKILYRKL